MALACLAYLLFVAYGSLVPFEFKAVSLDQAWEFFSGRSLRPGGETTRTDWVANVALGVPIGFLIAQSLGRRRMSWLPALAALLLGAALVSRVLPRAWSLALFAAIALGGAFYLFTTDGGWPALALFGAAGAGGWRLSRRQ